LTDKKNHKKKGTSREGGGRGNRRGLLILIVGKVGKRLAKKLAVEAFSRKAGESEERRKGEEFLDQSKNKWRRVSRLGKPIAWLVTREKTRTGGGPPTGGESERGEPMATSPWGIY